MLGLNFLINEDVNKASDPFDDIQKKAFYVILRMTVAAFILSLSTNLLEWSWTLFDTILYSSMGLILLATYILLRNNLYLFAVLLFIFSSVSLMFVLAVLDQVVYISSLFSLVMVMISIIVLKSQRLHLLIGFLLFIQQTAIFYILCQDYSFANTENFGENSHFNFLPRSIVYGCFYWFAFAMTFSLKWQITRSAVALRVKNKEIQNSYVEMEKFGHVISHDLKSPIRNMTNFAGLISKKLKTEQYEKVDEYASIIQDSGAKAIHLIDDVLTFSKLKNDDQQELKSSIDLDTMLLEVENDLLPLYPKSVVKFNQLGEIKGNYSKLKILFQNLIENGLKYNESENPIIRITRQVNGEEDSIKIEDNGIGIDEKHFKSIFEPFKRLHNDAAYSGTGIGLASCRSIVEEHLNGDLMVSSDFNKGSVFTIKLPIG